MVYVARSRYTCLDNIGDRRFAGWGNTFANTTDKTIAILRRNLYSAMLRKAAIYWLDLGSTGSFGRADNASTIAMTDAIWSNASHVIQQWTRLLSSSQLQRPLVLPSVAVFVDELSAAARPLLGRGGTIPEGWPFENALLQEPWQDIARIGAPVRVYLLSDLLLPAFSTDEIRLAVMLNVFLPDQTTKAAVRDKLQRDGRTVAWIYLPGLLDGDACTLASTPGQAAKACVPNATAASELTGLSLRVGEGAIPLTSQFEPASSTEGSVGAPVLSPALAGSKFGAELGTVAPWMYCGEGATTKFTPTVLARYVHQGSASVVWQPVQSVAGGQHNAVFVGTLRPPTGFWRSVARSAGVHLFTADPAGPIVGGANAPDSVEVGGSGLLFHAGDSDGASRRTIVLPSAFTVESEWGEVVCSAARPCTRFETLPARTGQSVLYWLGV